VFFFFFVGKMYLFGQFNHKTKDKISTIFYIHEWI